MAEIESQPCDIFTLTPRRQKSLADRFAEITLKNGVVLCGILYTIDPVSGSCVLITKESNTISAKIVLQDYVKHVAFPDMPCDMQDVAGCNFFNCDANQKSSRDVEKEKERVKSWLAKNMLSVEEDGDVLKLDSLEIHPPYHVEDCRSSNSIVLDRVQGLLRKMSEFDG